MSHAFEIPSLNLINLHLMIMVIAYRRTHIEYPVILSYLPDYQSLFR